MTRFISSALALLLTASPSSAIFAQAPPAQIAQPAQPTQDSTSAPAQAAPAPAKPASSSPVPAASPAVQKSRRQPRGAGQRVATPAPASPAAASPSGQAGGPAPAQAPASAPAQNVVGSTSLALPKLTSTAPIANSGIIVSGSDAKFRPSDDHPMLPMDAVGNPLGIRSGAPIHVLLTRTADSGHVRNGDVLAATLAAPIAGLARGTPVQLTVIQASQAGVLTSAGELSMQVTRIGDYNVLSVIVTALGKEGKKEVADAAPSPGTEAEFPAGQDLTFPAA